MRRINTTDGLYHNADVDTGEAGTIVTAEALNSIQEEIVAVILAAGVALDPADNTQLLAAITAITGAGVTWGAITNKPETATRWPVVAEVTGLQAALDARATPAQIDAAINALVNGSPGALDTLKELADAMGDDPNFAATVTNALATKAPINTPTFTGGAMGLTSGDPLKQLTTAAGDFVSWNYANGYNNGSFQWKFAGVTGMTLSKDNRLALGGGHAPTGVLDAYTGAGRIRFVTNGGSGNNIESILWDASNYATLNIGTNGNFTHNGSPIWTGLNFDPNSRINKAGDTMTGPLTTANGSSNGLAIERSPGSVGARIWKDTSATDLLYIDQLNGADIVARVAGVERMRITSSTVRSTGTIMAAGGFQVG